MDKNKIIQQFDFLSTYFINDFMARLVDITLREHNNKPNVSEQKIYFDICGNYMDQVTESDKILDGLHRYISGLKPDLGHYDTFIDWILRDDILPAKYLSKTKTRAKNEILREIIKKSLCLFLVKVLKKEAPIDAVLKKDRKLAQECQEKLYEIIKAEAMRFGSHLVMEKSNIKPRDIDEKMITPQQLAVITKKLEEIHAEKNDLISKNSSLHSRLDEINKLVDALKEKNAELQRELSNRAASGDRDREQPRDNQDHREHQNRDREQNHQNREQPRGRDQIEQSEPRIEPRIEELDFEPVEDTGIEPIVANESPDTNRSDPGNKPRVVHRRRHK